ncbi:glycosyltransferase family 4 protein [Mucilaginibacter achroorhodeus]|uniref:Glycosyltransferase family 4 protein n=1 Tax=Mucilaginibacter achroorhodeus TaxID=2599294 RepID=A0A563U6R7_9SPHI|nr:glycosyltransferase family 1 protein [Mucilaginibacter achroorhodeus]TWR27013.1 glycosyltransferase family 4 protein [Mucilaginibacter achroorhodeus]
MKQVVLVFRKPFEGQVSIEYLFYSLSSYLKEQNVSIINRQLSHYSKGLLNRLRNVFTITHYHKKIIHVTGDVHYTILGAWFSKRILTIHDLGFMLNKGPAAKFTYWLFWIYLPVKFSHQVTVVSENTKRDLLKYINVENSKVTVISNFIDAIYKPVVKPKCNLSTIQLLQIGTAFNKNISRLLDALEGLDCVLTIIGKLTDNLKKQLKEKQITYRNLTDLSIDDLYLEYQQADLLCYVSTLEGFGMPVLEAQATGTPVVCSNCSSMPEIAGDGACYVDPYDIASIRNGIEQVANDKQLTAKLISSGLINVRRFSKDAVAKAYHKIYQDL